MVWISGYINPYITEFVLRNMEDIYLYFYHSSPMIRQKDRKNVLVENYVFLSLYKQKIWLLIS